MIAASERLIHCAAVKPLGHSNDPSADRKEELHLPLRCNGAIWQVRQRGHVVIPEPGLVVIRNSAEEVVDSAVLAAHAMINSLRVQNAVWIPVHPSAEAGSV